jgi:N-acetylmuramoyl-L-alanine amidase CwlA
LKYLQNQNKIKSSNYVFIHNTENQGSSANLRKAAFQYCKPEEISMIVDGDDELIGRQVLKLFNAVYQ